MNEIFEQDCFSRTAVGLFKIGHDSFLLMNWMAWYDKYYEIVNYFDLMASVLKYLNDIT